jgi:hypothetical protein
MKDSVKVWTEMLWVSLYPDCSLKESSQRPQEMKLDVQT